MSAETLEELKAIIDGAPDNFTMVSFCGGFYGTITPKGWVLLNRTTREAKFVSINGLMAMRSLLEIKARIDLMEALQGLLSIVASEDGHGIWRNQVEAARKALGLNG